MEKINIAEILKDCPSGMELDCTLFDDVHFDSVDEVCDIIKCYIKDSHHKIGISFNKYGHYSNIRKAKCVIFPKGKTTWEGFQRPFNDGDIIYVCDEYSDAEFTYVAILKQIEEGEKIKSHCFYNFEDDYFSTHDFLYDGYNTRFATEKEKETLFKTIKDNGYKWNTETKTLEKLVEPKFKVGDRIKYINGKNKDGVKEGIILSITNDTYDVAVTNDMGIFVPISEQDNWELAPNKFDITTLKPFDKVLVRDGNKEKWNTSFYGFYDIKYDIKYPYGCCGNLFAQCIPYEGNEHLVGTTDDCDEFYKTW